jgi:glycosyltransferase involved in cell wall biosynthesis
VRIAVYDDQVYERVDGALWTDRTFPLFIAEVGESLERVVLLGRARTDPGARNFRLPDGVEFIGLPYYDSLVRPGAVVKGGVVSAWAFWRALADVDAAWVLGPHPLGFVFALLTILRGRRLILGVRQEMRSYARRRHPGRRLVHAAADLLEAGWRALARFSAVVVVGPELRRQYRHARRLFELHVSMMRSSQIAAPETERQRSYEGTITVLSVGRLDEEKNPLMLADVLAGLRAGGAPWRLVVCGTGACEAQLEARLESLGVADAAELKGYVPLDAGLRELYLEADAFLHVSWTEGVPQVLFEAFAARLPVVATDVGGVSAVAGDGAALMIGPGDPAAAVAALQRLAADPDLRRDLTDRGAEVVSSHTFESEAARTAAFLSA